MFNELNKPYVFHLVSFAIQRYQLFLDPYISLTYSIQNVNAVMESSKAFSDWIVLFKVNMCGFFFPRKNFSGTPLPCALPLCVLTFNTSHGSEPSTNVPAEST